MTSKMRNPRDIPAGSCALCDAHHEQLTYRFLHTPVCDDCGSAAQYLEGLAGRELRTDIARESRMHSDDSETLKARALLVKAQDKVVMALPTWHPAIKYAESKW